MNCVKCNAEMEPTSPSIICGECHQKNVDGVRMTIEERALIAHQHVLGMVVQFREKGRSPGDYVVPLVSYPSKSDYDYFKAMSSSVLMIQCEYEDYVEILSGIRKALKEVFGYESSEITVSRQDLINYIGKLEERA